MSKLIVYHLSKSDWGGENTAKRTGLCRGSQRHLHGYPCDLHATSVQDNGDSL